MRDYAFKFYFVDEHKRFTHYSEFKTKRISEDRFYELLNEQIEKDKPHMWDVTARGFKLDKTRMKFYRAMGDANGT